MINDRVTSWLLVVFDGCLDLSGCVYLGGIYFILPSIQKGIANACSENKIKSKKTIFRLQTLGVWLP